MTEVDTSEAIVVSSARLGRNFTQIPNFLLDNLSPETYYLACAVLRVSGERGVDDALVSTRWLGERMGCGKGKAAATKEALCNDLGNIFRRIPGDSRTGTADVIVVNREQLLIAHARDIAIREASSAAREKRTPRLIIVEYCGKQITVTADSIEETSLTKRQVSSEVLQVADALAAEVHTSSLRRGSKTAESQFEAAVRLAWNAGEHPRRVERRTALNIEERQKVAELLEAHGGDESAALDSWRLAVSEIAEIAKKPAKNFWADASKRPELINLLRNWSRWSDAGADRHRRMNTKIAPHPVKADFNVAEFPL